jgi:RNA polymerase sigma-54 factor
MALGPRLDLRQTQALVMTPQLRQAIKLLQFSNVEVASFIEEELERNPLLERDVSTEMPNTERAAPDQAPERISEAADAAQLAQRDTLPTETAAPLDVDLGETYDAGGVADGASFSSAIGGRGGARDFDVDERSIDDVADERRSLRDYLGEQLRLSFDDPVDRMIGAHLIALLCPAGRLTADPAAIADAMAIPLQRVEAVRAVMMRFDPVGLFARDLKECLAAQLAERDRLDPAMAALLDNLDLLARRELRRLTMVCGVDTDDLAEMIAEIRSLDPKPAASYDSVPAQTVIPDILMRPGLDESWLIELNPDTMPRLLVNEPFYARVAPRARR